jgi:phosphate transport system protein
MSRELFDKKLLEIKHNVLRMGTLVERVVDMSVTALKEQKLELAEMVNIEDNKIDKLDWEIENQCIALIALQQPLAKDLRIIASAMKVITDLERMGDNAVNIAKITLEFGKDPLFKPLVDIPIMSEIVQNMVKLSLDAFLNEDIELAEKVARMDEEVDRLYEKILHDILSIMIENSTVTVQATKLMFVGRYLERIADHTTNICERIIYMVTGEIKEIN